MARDAVRVDVMIFMFIGINNGLAASGTEPSEKLGSRSLASEM